MLFRSKRTSRLWQASRYGFVIILDLELIRLFRQVNNLNVDVQPVPDDLCLSSEALTPQLVLGETCFGYRTVSVEAAMAMSSAKSENYSQVGLTDLMYGFDYSHVAIY